MLSHGESGAPELSRQGIVLGPVTGKGKLFVAWIMVEPIKGGMRELYKDEHFTYQSFLDFGLKKREFGLEKNGERIVHVFQEDECVAITNLSDKRQDREDDGYHRLRNALQESGRDFNGFNLWNLLTELRISVP